MMTKMERRETENTSEEEAELEDNLASYAWMPRLMARLAIKL